MEHRVKILALALVCAAFSAQALTLGRLQGSALIGQPLNVGVDIQLDAGDDASALCLDAEVFQAETRQDPSRVRVVLEASTTPSIAHVRVISSALIEEPVVAFNLRNGCGQKIMRRYVLLADLPGEVAAPPVPLLLAPAVPPTPSRPEPAGQDAAAANLAPTAAATVASAPAEPEKARAPVASKPKPRSLAQRRAQAKGAKAGRTAAPKRSAPEIKTKPAVRSTGVPHLKLDPVEQVPDRVVSQAPVAALAPASVPASAPDAALLASQKVQQLESDVKLLRDSALKSEASLADLKARLQKAEAERFPLGLLYGLAALALAALLAAVYFWTRQRRLPPADHDWWTEAGAADAIVAVKDEAPAPVELPVVKIGRAHV